MPDWRDEVSGAVQAWLGADTSGHQAPRWKQIGMARPEGQGSFVVDLRVQGSGSSPRNWTHCDSARSDQPKRRATGITYSMLYCKLRSSGFGSRPTSSSTTFASGRCDSHPPTSSNLFVTVWRSWATPGWRMRSRMGGSLRCRHLWTVRSITELLTPAGADPAIELDHLSQGLAEAVGRYVRVVGIHDARSFFSVLEDYLERAKESVWIWAPWTASRADTVLPMLQATVERGVRVSIFTRPERAPSRESWRQRLRELREIVSRVVAYSNMHQKIVVVGDRTALLGSLNPLSHCDTREVMVEHEGPWFATNLLQHEYAEHFINAPECDVCRVAAELRRAAPDKLGEPPWSWRCGNQGCGWMKDATPPSFVA